MSSPEIQAIIANSGLSAVGVSSNLLSRAAAESVCGAAKTSWDVQVTIAEAMVPAKRMRRDA
jgi:hypothetical protein